MRLYIIRHADPDYANDTITPQGELEAAALATRLAAMGIDELYCSPKGRARATAAYAAEALGLEPVVLEWTRELHDFNLLDRPSMALNVHGHVVRQRPYLDNLADPSPIAGLPLARMAEVEAEIAAASDAFLGAHGYVREDGIYRVVARSEAQVAVVCHAGFGLTWLAHLLAIPEPLVWIGFHMHPTSVTTVLFDERVEGIATPRCLAVGDVGHLYAARLEPSVMGIIANRA